MSYWISVCSLTSNFHDESSGVRHVRRMFHPGRGLGGPRARRSNMHFTSSTTGGLSTSQSSSQSSNYSREAMDPIAGQSHPKHRDVVMLHGKHLATVVLLLRAEEQLCRRSNKKNCCLVEDAMRQQCFLVKYRITVATAGALTHKALKSSLSNVALQ